MLLWMGSVDIPIGDSTTSQMANMLPHQLIPKVIWVGGETQHSSLWESLMQCLHRHSCT